MKVAVPRRQQRTAAAAEGAQVDSAPGNVAMHAPLPAPEMPVGPLEPVADWLGDEPQMAEDPAPALAKSAAALPGIGTTTGDGILIDADGTDTVWADYPGVGFNKKWIVVQVNMYLVSDDSFDSTAIYVFDKSAFCGGTAAALGARWGTPEPRNVPLVGMSPSIVLFWPGTTHLDLGVDNFLAGDSSVRQIDLSQADPNVNRKFEPLDPAPLVIGAPSLDVVNTLLHVGSVASILYAVRVPFP